MEYKKLAFEDYFTICSENWNDLDTDLRIAKFEEVKYIYKKKEYIAEYQVRLDSARQCIQVIFQQTYEKSDWVVNFDFPTKIYDKFTFDGQLIQLRAHGGWVRMWLAMQDIVREKIGKLLANHPNFYIEVFGWSLGSGIAQLAAEDIYFKFGKKPYLYTYGSVKPFFGKKTYEYVKSCCAAAYNFYDHCDVVGYMVPFFGWRAINHIKVKLEKHFCITKLFNPWKYHTKYDMPELYKDVV